MHVLHTLFIYSPIAGFAYGRGGAYLTFRVRGYFIYEVVIGCFFQEILYSSEASSSSIVLQLGGLVLIMLTSGKTFRIEPKL